MSDAHIALYRKWRPLTFDDVFGQNSITTALRTQVAQGRLSHAYLFTGTRGTGKTTCAKILARAACCLNPINGNPCNQCAACRGILEETALDVSEIDAASNNGVDNIRAIREEAVFSPSQLKKRVYIIDEVHMLSGGAFNALLKTLEEPPEHVLFILATTELHKVPATILSRCQRYDFRRIAPEVIAQRLSDISKAEGFALEPDATRLLARLGDGSMRDAISLMDRCLPESGAVTRQMVTESLGIAAAETLSGILSAVIGRDAAKALSLFSQAYLDGRDVLSLFDELLSLVRDVYIMKVTGDEKYLMSTCAYDAPLLKGFAESCDGETLEYFAETISEILSKLTRTAIRRTDGEMCLLKLCLRHGASSAPPTVLAYAESEKKSAPSATPAPAPAAPAPAAPKAPMRTEAPAPKAGGDSELKDRFLSLVSMKVNSAVRTYLGLAQMCQENGVLKISVPEESLGFMSKPTVMGIFREEALNMGCTEVTVKEATDVPPAVPAPGAGLADVLNNAKKFGIKID